MSMHTNPFEILGLPVRRDLTDEQIDAAWRKIAVATHPDRPDGGDLARYTQASAAFAELRVPWSRSEAYADVVGQARAQGYDGLDDDGQPYTEPLPRVPFDPESGISHGDPVAILIQLPSRISRGRPLHLALRAIIAAALSLIVLQLIPGSPAAPADILGLIIWFVLTGRKDLAPPPER
jgi:curved DNA-binding protein CbpA